MGKKTGIVYDAEYIIPWINKFSIDPVSGEKLGIRDLTRLHFNKNSDGNYACPISGKEFSMSKAIVAIKKTGNVYSLDTITTLNIKPGFWNDLITDEPFTRKDIIKILDPEDIDSRTVSKFYCVAEKLPVKEFLLSLCTDPKDTIVNTTGINADSSTLNILKELSSSSVSQKKLKMEPKETKETKNDNNTTNFYSVSTSMSFTSTALDPITKGVALKRSDEEYMFKSVSENGYVQISTNLGNLNFELFCKKAPRTCYNFMKLAKMNYYDNVQFHRLIPNLIVQGGDPTGTGNGGESYWKTPFKDEISSSLSHCARGILSMANKGKDTNTSQFFITFRACEHLDRRHTVFGRLVGGAQVLLDIENVPTDSKDFPKHDIRISTVNVFVDPFEKFEEKDPKEVNKKIEKPQKTLNLDAMVPGKETLERTNKNTQEKSSKLKRPAS